jgi:hypothetical protein
MRQERYWLMTMVFDEEWKTLLNGVLPWLMSRKGSICKMAPLHSTWCATRRGSVARYSSDFSASRTLHAHQPDEVA